MEKFACDSIKCMEEPGLGQQAGQGRRPIPTQRFSGMVSEWSGEYSGDDLSKAGL